MNLPAPVQQRASLAVKVRRKKRRKAVAMRVVGVPLPVKNRVTVNQTAKKVQERKHLEQLRKVIRRTIKRKQRGSPRKEAHPVPQIQSPVHQKKVLQIPSQNQTLKVKSLENLEELLLVSMLCPLKWEPDINETEMAWSPCLPPLPPPILTRSVPQWGAALGFLAPFPQLKMELDLSDKWRESKGRSSSAADLREEYLRGGKRMLVVSSLVEQYRISGHFITGMWPWMALGFSGRTGREGEMAELLFT
ncbi:PREDICTED: uncharacterized protein LOC104569497 [Tinamus guttatus]|uniref:uncharacterized protein LOC104569497 n=1 Tax=Tinamus guttatus TaxID=94827 RepID=UPI00052E8F8D|nr:PREDICTED: uncharacterized protein LOC104569497 [Tinamus guttatus]